MFRRHLAVLFVLACAAVVVAGSVDENEESRTIANVKAVLGAQAKAWNIGDIEGFMDGYVRSKELRFSSGDSITRGWQPTLVRYRERYTDRDIMGTLAFKDLDVLLLSDTYVEVFGSWHLTRKAEQGDASGLFTLLMKKTPAGWKVLHDHTSSAEQK